jgi:predicted metal-dependent enzyme (double-stranded beta helix superfamily)
MVDTDELVAQCIAAAAETEPVLAVKEVLARAVDRPDALRSATGFGDHVGFHVLHRAADLTVLDVVWPPTASILPHDHRMWAAIAIYRGQEDNTFFRREATTIVESGRRAWGERDVYLLGDDVVHGIHNPHRTATKGIHVYGGDLIGVARSQWTGTPLQEEPYDFDESQREFERAAERARAITPP